MTERDACTAIIAAEIEAELGTAAALAAAGRIVAALDAAAEDAGLKAFEAGDIVQLIEGGNAGVLFIVDRAGSEGVDVFPGGPSSRFLFSFRPEQLERTGGRSSFKRPASEGAN